MYHSIFKCRMCSKEYVEGGTQDEMTAIKSALDACSHTVRLPQAPELCTVHFCGNGDYGIADFIGFRKVDDKEQ